MGLRIAMTTSLAGTRIAYAALGPSSSGRRLWSITLTFRVEQAYLHLRRLGYRSPDFTQRWPYAWCRHPMMLGLVIVFWATPRMTVGHLFFAAAATAYIAVGIRFEERDLRARLSLASGSRVDHGWRRTIGLND